MLTGQILITGGCGALGRAIIHRAIKENWDCRITVYSRDVMKQHAVKKMYPSVGFIVGDILDYTTLSNAMVGKDLVLHLAAQKHIPEGEYYSINNFETNVTGSLNVCMAAAQLGIPKVLAISTDKACHSANAYGSSKYMMEKIIVEYSRMGLETSYNLVRFGNILESTGSVIQVWKEALARGESIKITDPRMTRFWLSPQQAVDMVIASFELPSGLIYIPKMKALSIGKLADYVLPPTDFQVESIPLRPGEKMHETLLTIEECEYAIGQADHFILHPTTSRMHNPYHLLNKPYTSDTAEELTKDELMELLKNE